MNKIKLSLLALVCVMSLNTARGQAEVAIGLKGGLNFATLDGVSSPSTAWSNSTGYHFGAFVLFKLTKIGIQPEIVFSQQGHKFTYNGANYQNNFNYVNIPVILKLYLVGGLNLQAGPQFGFVSSATGDVLNTASGVMQTGQDMKSFLNSTDFTVAVGLGWDLPFGLNLTARYNIGTSDINKYTGGTIPNNVTSSMGTSSAKNQVFQFSVGFRIFKLGK